MKLVKKLYSSFVEHRAADSTRLCLRAKNSINPVLTDRELFQSMPLGDAWEDASVASVYFYLRKGRFLVIPDSWQATIDDFDRDLQERVASLTLALQGNNI